MRLLLLILTISEVSSNGGTSADNIANDIGQSLSDYLDRWFDVKWIESVFSQQKYNTMTGWLKSHQLYHQLRLQFIINFGIILIFHSTESHSPSQTLQLWLSPFPQVGRSWVSWNRMSPNNSTLLRIAWWRSETQLSTAITAMRETVRVTLTFYHVSVTGQFPSDRYKFVLLFL